MKRIMIILAMLFLAKALSGQTSEKEHDVYVIAHLNEKIPSTSNIVYAPTFRASWTILKNEIIGADIVLTKSLSLTAGLNRYPFNVPDNKDWLAMAGFVEKGILKEISSAMQKKSGIRETGLGRFTDEEGIVCYSYMSKTLRFAQTFETLSWDFLGNEESQTVECFGVSKGAGKDKAAMREQVSIHDYRNPDDFIIRISPKEPGKEIILAKIPRGRTMSGMISEIDDRIDLPGKIKLSEIDELVIPKIEFDIEHSYNELLGLFLKNKGFEDYFFARAVQKIGFTLDESGAEARATGEIIIKKGPRSRLYIFDKPFMVILRDTGSSEPDLVAWVDNTNILKVVE
jgi:hypothetical protein